MIFQRERPRTGWRVTRTIKEPQHVTLHTMTRAEYDAAKPALAAYRKGRG